MSTTLLVSSMLPVFCFSHPSVSFYAQNLTFLMPGTFITVYLFNRTTLYYILVSLWHFNLTIFPSILPVLCFHPLYLHFIQKNHFCLYGYSLLQNNIQVKNGLVDTLRPYRMRIFCVSRFIWAGCAIVDVLI